MYIHIYIRIYAYVLCVHICDLIYHPNIGGQHPDLFRAIKTRLNAYLEYCSQLPVKDTLKKHLEGLVIFLQILFDHGRLQATELWATWANLKFCVDFWLPVLREGTACVVTKPDFF